MSEISFQIENWNCEDINDLISFVETARAEECGFDADFYDAWAYVRCAYDYCKYILATCKDSNGVEFAIHTVDKNGYAYIYNNNSQEKIAHLSELHDFCFSKHFADDRTYGFEGCGA